MKGLTIIRLGILLILFVEARGRSNKSSTQPERQHQRQHLKNLQQQQQVQANSNAPSSQEERSSEFVKGKICIGTNGRMSVPSNREYHYRNLRDRYTNCTYVDGNLEITWLENATLNLDFLKNIREVTGYVLISHVNVQDMILPKLQIIRGRTLFKIGVDDDPFALFVSYSHMNTLQMPALRDILAGSVSFFNCDNLCYLNTIKWDEIISGVNATIKFPNSTTFSPSCPKCHMKCKEGCWGQGEENCQKFSKINCSPQCAQGRCFGTEPRQCCHLFCAGGCTGPTQKDCYACKNFYDDGVCKEECPPMQKYNPTNYFWEPNPEGKYAYGATCVRNCPEHLLKDNGACVRTCPHDKMERNGECVLCNGPCPKTCPGLVVVHSGNIDSYRGCTIIEGSIEILDQTFLGFQHVYSNYSFGPRYIKMNPERLEVFSTLKEITGYINIQGHHENFTNLTYFRNLEVIGGRQLVGHLFASLYIVKTSLRSLDLVSLKKINAGTIAIVENEHLCFVQSINWKKLTKDSDRVIINNNRNKTSCENDDQVCSDQCNDSGCFGLGSEQCLECLNFSHNGSCIASCDSVPNLYQNDSQTCSVCHPECKGCTGPDNNHCNDCVNVRDGNRCVPNCPESKYEMDGVCTPCHETCIGCYGPRDTIAKDGCKTCYKAIMSGDATIERCLKRAESCPDNYYYEWVVPQEQGPLKHLVGKAICRKCHPRCKRCTGYGFHEKVCQECTGYKHGEQCEDECPNEYFADEEKKKCIECHVECRGCTGSGPDQCLQCHNYKIFRDGDPNDNSTMFNCTATCPKSHPHKIFPQDQHSPYCSKKPNVREHFQVIGGYNIYIAGGFALIFCILFVFICIFFQKAKASKDAAKMTKVLTGEDSVPLKPTNVGPNLTKLRIIKEAELRRGGVLGMGAFGRVHKGVWIPEGENYKIPVAIKVLIDISGAESSKEFLEEAYIMASVEHPNLLKLLAVCMTNEIMLITQLMPLGCLLDYVRKNKRKIGSKAFLDWSCQIAKGMQYLEENRLVHRDLAARNVLVQTPSHVKITDFGLAKLLDFDSDEYKATGGKMPIKWLALECIRHRIFTSKSDVWAFGVTIWELLTYGSRPYPDIEAKDLVVALEKGHRLYQPQICTLDVYMILLSCWLIDANARPTFKQLYDKFSEMSSDPGRYLVIEGDKFLRLPAYTSKDEKDLIRQLANEQKDDQNNLVGSDEYLQPTTRSQTTTTGSSFEHPELILSPSRECTYPIRNSSSNDETDSRKRGEIGLGNMRLNLPLDEDDYLMPTCNPQNSVVPGYMDLTSVPPTSFDNPEYLIGAANRPSVSGTMAPPPTQTIGIPIVPPGEVEQTSDQEYYNDFQREMQPLRRNETTV